MGFLQSWKMTDMENLHNLSDRLEGSASIFVRLLPENQQISLLVWGKVNMFQWKVCIRFVRILIVMLVIFVRRKKILKMNLSLFIEEEHMKETISIKEIMDVIKKRAKMIVSFTLIMALLGGIISYFFLTPIYEASTQILVNKGESENSVYSSTDIMVDLQLVETYNVIINSPTILETVIEDLDLDLTVNELKDKITVTSESDSQVINVAVEDKSITTATAIANKIAEVFKEEIVNIMNVNNVTILTKAKVTGDETPVFPNNILIIAIFMVAGLTSGIGLAFLREYLDNTYTSDEEIESHLQLPVLGVIPTFEEL
mgnify:CR=1 FL=1